MLGYGAPSTHCAQAHTAPLSSPLFHLGPQAFLGAKKVNKQGSYTSHRPPKLLHSSTTGAICSALLITEGKASFSFFFLVPPSLCRRQLQGDRHHGGTHDTGGQSLQSTQHRGSKRSQSSNPGYENSIALVMRKQQRREGPQALLPFFSSLMKSFINAIWKRPAPLKHLPMCFAQIPNFSLPPLLCFHSPAHLSGLCQHSKEAPFTEASPPQCCLPQEGTVT